MNRKVEVDRLRRALGVEPGPRVPCPSCEGSGQTYEIDGARHGWSIERKLAAVLGRPFDLPEPDEPSVACGTCRGVGTVSEAVAVHEQRPSGETLIERKIAAAIERKRAAEASDDPPALHSVDD